MTLRDDYPVIKGLKDERDKYKKTLEDLHAFLKGRFDEWGIAHYCKLIIEDTLKENNATKG